MQLRPRKISQGYQVSFDECSALTRGSDVWKDFFDRIPLDQNRHMKTRGLTRQDHPFSGGIKTRRCQLPKACAEAEAGGRIAPHNDERLFLAPNGRFSLWKSGLG
jgi:hypothetical protein